MNFPRYFHENATGEENVPCSGPGERKEREDGCGEQERGRGTHEGAGRLRNPAADPVEEVLSVAGTVLLEAGSFGAKEDPPEKDEAVEERQYVKEPFVARNMSALAEANHESVHPGEEREKRKGTKFGAL